MPGILSQEEIDQLVSSVAKGKTEEKRPFGARKKAIPYDFRQQNIIPKASLHAIKSLHTDFAKSLSIFLLRTVKNELGVKLATVNSLPLGEFIKSRANPTYLSLVRLKPYNGELIIDISPNLVFLLVDLLFGGTGSPPPANGVITHMEKKFMRKLVEGMLSEFKAIWEKVTPFHPRIETEGTDPAIAGSPSDLENAMMVTYELTLGEGSEGHLPLSFCYTAKLLKSLVAVLGQKKVGEGELPPREEAQTEELLKSLSQVEMPVSVELGRTLLTIRDLIGLQIGDVIRLDNYIDDELKVEVEDRAKFLARPGAYRGRKAVIISSIFKEGEVRNGQQKGKGEPPADGGRGPKGG